MKGFDNFFEGADDYLKCIFDSLKNYGVIGLLFWVFIQKLSRLDSGPARSFDSALTKGMLLVVFVLFMLAALNDARKVHGRFGYRGLAGFCVVSAVGAGAIFASYFLGK